MKIRSVLMSSLVVWGFLVRPAIATAAGSGAKARSYILATASAGGTFYPVGVAIATLIKLRLAPEKNVSMSAITSAGSGDNVNLIRNREAQFGILQSLYGAWAWNGKGPFQKIGPQKQLRSTTMLWQNVEHFVVGASSVQGSTLLAIKALYGKRFSIGKNNSGTEGSGRHILASIGIDPDAFNNVHMGYGSSASALRDGRIDGMNIPGGVPVGAITRAYSSLGDKIKILNIGPSLLEKINKTYPLWSPYTIRARTYPKQGQAIKTIAQPNFLAVHKDVPEEDVYLIVKTVYQNLAFLSGIHAATKVMALDRAVAGLSVPLHSGAVRFYREAGLDIPPRLVVKQVK